MPGFRLKPSMHICPKRIISRKGVQGGNEQA